MIQRHDCAKPAVSCSQSLLRCSSSHSTTIDLTSRPVCCSRARARNLVFSATSSCPGTRWRSGCRPVIKSCTQCGCQLHAHLPTVRKTHKVLLWDLSRHLEQTILRDLETRLGIRRPMHMDSTAGPSLTSTGAISPGLSALELPLRSQSRDFDVPPLPETGLSHGLESHHLSQPDDDTASASKEDDRQSSITDHRILHSRDQGRQKGGETVRNSLTG